MGPVITANGHPVLAGTVRVPQRGAIMVNLAIDAEHESMRTGAPLLVRCGDGATLRATIIRADDDRASGATVVRAVAGAGYLRKPLAGRFYARSTFGDVARDACTDAGECLAELDPAIATLAARCQVREAGNLLADVLGHVATMVQRARRIATHWRVGFDGAVRIEHDSLEAIIPLGDSVSVRTYVGDAIDTRVVPGVCVAGETVTGVQHIIAGTAVRTIVWRGGDAEGGGAAN